MSEFINTADVIGDDEMCDQIIMRTVTKYCENRISKIGQYAFYGCTALTVVDVPNVTSIEANSLCKCSCKALILRSDAVTTLTNTNALTDSGIATGTGHVYVPSALLASYQAATNWSTYSEQFRALEDYETLDISLNATELTFTTADPKTLIATIVPTERPITWTSSDKAVVKVSDNGVVTPVSDGVAIITASGPMGERVAECKVTVNAGLELLNILEGIAFNAGYTQNGSITAGGTSDIYSDTFPVMDYSGQDIIVTLLDVKSTASYNRICYYDANSTFISQKDGTTSGSNVVITSTVPTNAVYAVLSINKSNGFSGIDIVCDDVAIGTYRL